MSERKRQLARLRKQRQRSCMNPDVQRQEARRHQHASRANIIYLNQVIARQACLKNVVTQYSESPPLFIFSSS